jgi:hypothetical protein
MSVPSVGPSFANPIGLSDKKTLLLNKNISTEHVTLLSLMLLRLKKLTKQNFKDGTSTSLLNAFVAILIKNKIPCMNDQDGNIDYGSDKKWDALSLTETLNTIRLGAKSTRKIKKST